MAQPRIFRVIVQALLGLLLLAWLPVVGDAPEFPFLPQLEKAFSLSDPSDGGDEDREPCPERWSDGAAPFQWSAVCRLVFGVSGRAIRGGTPETVLFLNLLESWRTTGPPALGL